MSNTRRAPRPVVTRDRDRVVCTDRGRTWTLPASPSVDTRLALEHTRRKMHAGAAGDRLWIDLDAVVGPEVARDWRELPHDRATELLRGLLRVWGAVV